jgi:hypothetical protein
MINVNGIDVEVKYKDTPVLGFWQHDKVIIYDPDNIGISGVDIREILQYLFDEGFIKDRRTPWEILNPHKETR